MKNLWSCPQCEVRRLAELCQGTWMSGLGAEDTLRRAATLVAWTCWGSKVVSIGQRKLGFWLAFAGKTQGARFGGKCAADMGFNSILEDTSLAGMCCILSVFVLKIQNHFEKSSWKVQKHCQVSMMQKCFMCVAYLWSDGPFRQAVSLLFEVCCEWSCHKFPSIESLEWPKPWVFAVRGWHPTHLYGD